MYFIYYMGDPTDMHMNIQYAYIEHIYIYMYVDILTPVFYTCTYACALHL